MNKKANFYVWQAITPVHCGTGQAGAATIDLPIIREAATNYPFLPASSIKGVLRDGGTSKEDNSLYGSQDKIGSLSFTDAQLLCFPVRSYKQTFAYITCNVALERLRQQLELLEIKTDFPVTEDLQNIVHVSSDDLIDKRDGKEKVLFEDVDISAKENQTAKEIAEILADWNVINVKNRLAVVPNDIFSYFVESATAVFARNRIDETTKTTVDGALWYEEALPQESVLTSFVIGGEMPNKQKILRIGGKSSIGRGILSVHKAEEKTK